TGKGPEAGAGCEQITYSGSGGSQIGAQGKIRQHGGHCDADLSAGGMQLFFSGAHIRALLHQFGGEADRQVLRKAERRKLELLLQFLVRETSGKGREQIASLCQLIPEWRQGLL